MNTRLFVGLTFFGDDHLSRKIQGFKKRYDPKFNSHPVFHMSLIAPFEIHQSNRESLIEDLTDEVENYFYGEEDCPRLGFTGLDVHQVRRHNILYLNPHYNDDLGHCMEGIKETCMSYIPREVAYRPNKKQFLPLGDFPDPIVLHNIVDMAKDEFTANGELGISGISVFEKRMGIWIEANQLISFERKEKAFLHLKEYTL
jgi:2'-5' RNA ligase